jgi:flavodoxin
VETENRKVLIIYAPEGGQMPELAGRLAEKVDSATFDISVQSAKDTKIPEITASDILFFGAESESDISSENGYKEIARALTGINLSPRPVGLFSFSSENSISGLKKMVEDTGLNPVQDDLVFQTKGKSVKDKKIDKWIKTTCSMAAV